MDVRVYITPKQGILDPQGVAIERSLPALGFEGVTGVRVGKFIELQVTVPAGTPEERYPAPSSPAIRRRQPTLIVVLPCKDPGNNEQTRQRQKQRKKIADGPQGQAPCLVTFRDYYGQRAYANALAHAGFTVMVPDTFLWGSRRFPLETMLKSVGGDVEATRASWWPAPDDQTFEIRQYNVACGYFEHVAAKYANLLGTNISGVVSHEDRIAFNYLLSRPDVDAGHAGCLGLSGGGNRAVLLQASHDQLKAAVIVGLMSTYPGLFDHNIAGHTWMFFPSLWSRCGDWPDIAACRAPSPILAQYDNEDELFTLQGMQAAHQRLQQLYRIAGAPDAYTGQFYPGGHKFDLEMQAAAFAWLKEQLGA